MTRSEQEMYRNIERIAVALETIVIQGKDQKLAQFKKATNVIYGNDNKGRSSDNYQYPDKQTKSIRKDGLSGYKPNIQSDLDQHIYDTSQQVIGGEFQSWFASLSPIEQESYNRIYNNAPTNADKI